MSVFRKSIAGDYISTAKWVRGTQKAHHSSMPAAYRLKDPPSLPRKGGIPQKTRIPGVKRVVAVSSAKGGVGKSTVAANLAMALAMHPSKPTVGLLDLDIFGPSIPRIMGLVDAPEPELNKFENMIPLQNHGVQCMSMGFLLSREPHVDPRRPDPSRDPSPTWSPTNREYAPVVWRGLMVQKATQQLLFEVDWSGGGRIPKGVDVLVVDMPPGTGDVALTLGQLVIVDGAIIVSTAQDVALADVKKGVSMFQRVKVPMLGMLLNMSHYVCPSCLVPHDVFGTSASIERAAEEMDLSILGRLPLVSQLSWSADRGVPIMLDDGTEASDGVQEIRRVLKQLASTVVQKIG